MSERNLRTNARRYATVLQLLYARQQIKARLITATRGARHMTFGIRLADPMSLDRALKLSETIALASRSKAVLGYRNEGLIVYQFQLASMYWESYTRASVTGLGIGLGDMRSQVNFEFDETAPQALFAGTTGSGKTEAIKSTLVALAQNNTPDDLQFIMIDRHHQLGDFANLAHLAAPVAYDESDVDYVLKFAEQEYARRLANNVNDAPRLVVVFDEAAEVLEKNERRLQIVKDLANGRKFRVNVILGTQKPSHKDWPGVLDKLQNKFVGLVSDARMSANVTGQAGLEAHKLTGQGDFLHVVGPRVKRFQVALTQRTDIEALPRSVNVAMPGIDDEAVFNFPKEPVEKGEPGRPPNELDAPLLARYLGAGPDNISVRQGKKLFGISQAMHMMHRDFALDLLDELAKLNLHLCEMETTTNGKV